MGVVLKTVHDFHEAGGVRFLLNWPETLNAN